jgi:phage gp46-like protein
MPDITVVWDVVNQRGDWAVAAGDLQLGNDLQSAVLLSLFTDRGLPRDQLPPDGTDDRRGWWGDSFERTPIGSRLWTLSRRVKFNAQALLLEAQGMCQEALQWLIDDGVTAAINVVCAWSAPDQMTILVAVVQPNLKTPTQFRFDWAWKQLS